MRQGLASTCSPPADPAGCCPDWGRDAGPAEGRPGSSRQATEQLRKASSPPADAPKSHPVLGGADRHRRAAGKQPREDALPLRVEVLDQYEGHPGSGRQALDQRGSEPQGWRTGARDGCSRPLLACKGLWISRRLGIARPPIRPPRGRVAPGGRPRRPDRIGRAATPSGCERPSVRAWSGSSNTSVMARARASGSPAGTILPVRP